MCLSPLATIRATALLMLLLLAQQVRGEDSVGPAPEPPRLATAAAASAPTPSRGGRSGMAWGTGYERRSAAGQQEPTALPWPAARPFGSAGRGRRP